MPGRFRLGLCALNMSWGGLYSLNSIERGTMNGKIITVESRPGAPLFILHRVMRMVPDKDKGDKRLQRLLAFRLQHDGEAATCDYLMRHIRRYIRHPKPMGFYDFLIQPHGREPVSPSGHDHDPNPPGVA